MAEKPALSKKELTLLNAIYSESGGKEINLDYSVLKIGEQIGLTQSDTVQIIKELILHGFIRQSGPGQSIVVTQYGRGLLMRESVPKPQSGEDRARKPYNFFISHIHENEPVATKLKDYLANVTPVEITVFISGDPESISGGQDWFTTIIDGIRKCDCMVILCTPKSVERKWIHFEAGAAAVLGKKIIPFCFAGLKPGDLPSPLDHIRTQAIDSDDTEKMHKHLEILVKEIAGRTNDNNSFADFQQSDFYDEIQSAHPRNQLVPFKLPQVKRK